MDLFLNQILAGIATGAIYACMALAVVMNRKKFESLPPQAQKAIRDHSFDYINKLYVDSMLVYDKQLVQRLRRPRHHLRHDNQPAAMEQRTPHFPHGKVESE